MSSRWSAGRLPSESSAPGGFEILDAIGPARELVLAREPAPHRRLVFCEVTGKALVLGSTEPAEHADRAGVERLGAEIVRRASGGGAVFVAPRAQVWADAFVPADDPLLRDDVAESALWFGRAWAEAISRLSGRDVEVTPPCRVRGRWARWLCFSVLGPGEVSDGGVKLVGISQRRTRAGAWFHSMAPLRRTDEELVECLALDRGEKAECSALLARVSAPVAVDGALLRERLTSFLSR